jgi:hypothetical protein
LARPNPSASGHETIRTDTNVIIAKAREPTTGAIYNQRIKLIMATRKTMGTK